MISKLYAQELRQIVPGKPVKDAKTRLQEYLQGRSLPLPQYTLTGTSGEAHAQSFKVSCRIESLHLFTEGTGGSRRAAEQMAAERALEKVNHT